MKIELTLISGFREDFLRTASVLRSFQAVIVIGKEQYIELSVYKFGR